MSHRKTYRLTLSSLLLSIMLVLGYVESLLPTGIPGVKLGLSNGVLIFAVYMLDLPTAWILMSLKVLLSGLLFSGVSAMLYAFAGGVLSLTGMCLLSRVRSVPVTAVSMVGGLLHNAGQVALAMLILHTPMLAHYMGILILVGLACGALTGVAATAVMRHLKTAGFARETAGAGRLPLWIAVLLVIAVAAFAWWRLPRTGGVEVTFTPITDDQPALTPADQLPPGLVLPE